MVPGQHLGCHIHGHELAELDLCDLLEPGGPWVLDHGPDEGVLVAAGGDDHHLDQLPWPEGLDYAGKRVGVIGTGASGVVSVTAEVGASIVVTFTNGSHTVTKTLTGNGSTAVPVVLSSADLVTLGDGTISVSAKATDAVGNASSAGSTSFTLDTTAPVAVADAATLTEDFVTSTGNVATNDTALDGTENFALVGANGSGNVTGTYAGIHMNANGTYTLSPNSATIHAITSNVTETFTYRVTDAVGNTSTSTLTFTFTPVNTAPVNTVPGAQTTIDGASKVITGLSMTDVDTGSSTMSVTLAVAHGTITVANGSGVTLTTNGTGTAVKKVSKLSRFKS